MVGEKMHAWKIVIVTLILTVAINRLVVTEAIWMNIESDGTRKCVSEEINKNVVVLADFLVIDDKGISVPTVSSQVTSPYGNELYKQENVTHGQFAFTANEVGSYVACFWLTNTGHQSATLNIDWKIGFNAKDWDSVAKKENIEGLELELRKLEGSVEAIHERLIQLQDREWEMRVLSEKTNARVAWYGTMSLGVGIIASIYQVWHLKRYFQKRKLI